jgi:AcrR family transcriptional regulator
MLVHHFGSRDALIAAALGHARSQLLDTCRAQLAEQSPRDLRGLVSALPAIITDPVNRLFFRLFGEVNALAQTQPNSLYNGNNHIPYDGSYKVIAAADFDWDGHTISNFRSNTDYGETIRYLQYTVDNYSTQNSRLVECISQRAHASSAADVEQVGPTGFKLTYSAAHPIVLAAPAIDATLFGTVAPDGSLSLSYDSDLFPSHGFRVVKNGATQVTQTISDASCLGSAFGARGAALIAWGLTHEDNHGTFTVAASDSGRIGSSPSLMCSTGYWLSIVSDQKSKAYLSFINSTSGRASRSADAAPRPRARVARRLGIEIAVVGGRGHPMKFMSLESALSKGLVSAQTLPSGVAIFSLMSAPVAVRVTGVRPQLVESQVVRGMEELSRVYGGQGTMTAMLGARATLTGDHIRQITGNVSAPVTTARVTRQGKFAIVRFSARSPVGVVRTFAILAGTPIKVSGNRIRVPLSKLRQLRFASVDELGNVEKPRGVR